MRLLVILTLALAAAAQTPVRDLQLEPDSNARRLALVIGNQAYPKWPLKNPVNDAKSIDAALREMGFRTTLVGDGTLRMVERAIDRFIGDIRPGDVALFYYSGHGVQLSGENYLVPVDFDAKDEADAKYVTYSISRVSERMEAAGARLNLLILDACRTNPFRNSRAGAGGLAAMNTGRGTFIAFATGPGRTADDSPAAHNGLFTGHVVAAMREPGLTLDSMFNRVREKVYAESGGQQIPWSVSSVIGEFRFRPVAGGSTGAPPASPVPVSPPATAAAATGNPLAPRNRPEAPAPKPDVAGLSAEATAALSRGDYDHAMRVAQEVLRVDPSRKEALFALAAGQFQTGQYDVFESTAVQALAAGASFPFVLIHHHTLTGGHRASLVVSRAAIAFDPLGAKDCNQAKFAQPLSTLVSASRLNGTGGELYLSVKVRDAQNRVRTLNFADADSTVDTSSGLPVLRPPAKAPRMLQAIIHVIEAARRL